MMSSVRARGENAGNGRWIRASCALSRPRRARSAFFRLLVSALLVASAAAWLPRGLSQTDQTHRVTFVDATGASGLRFRHQNSSTPNKYLMETMSGGVAVFDFDSDGWLDVFFVNGARLKNPHPDGEPPDKSSPEFWNRLFRNNRDATFTDVTEKAGLQGTGYGMGAATGDCDNDGLVDLLVTHYGGAVLYRNNGNGSFTDVTRKAGVIVEGWATSAGFLDYDRDGNLDLFVCRYVKWDFRSGARFCGTTQPGGRAYCHPDEFQPISNYLFRNRGNGTFTDVSEASGIGAHEGKALGVGFADYNRDGFTDIYVANDSFQQFLFQNNGNGTFSEVGALAGIGYTEDGQTFAGMGTDFADLNGDGFPDIITTALPYQYFAYFQNNRDGTFSYSSFPSNLAEITRLFSGWGMRVFDYDNDGGKDVFFANSHVMDNIELTQPQVSYLQKPLLLKYSAGKFSEISSRSGAVFDQAWSSRGAAIGDLDNDGNMDVVVSTCGGPAYFLRNDGGHRQHWMGLELVGKKNNRAGLGAEVVLTTASGKTHHGVSTTAGSYLSASDRRVHFGLGQESAIKEIRIIWPGGSVQTIDAPKADQYLTVEEIIVKGKP